MQHFKDQSRRQEDEINSRKQTFIDANKSLSKYIFIHRMLDIVTMPETVKHCPNDACLTTNTHHILAYMLTDRK